MQNLFPKKKKVFLQKVIVPHFDPFKVCKVLGSRTGLSSDTDCLTLTSLK